MTPLELLEKAVTPLKASDAKFAVAGGLASCFYRLRPRLTNDVDVCLLASPADQSQAVASMILDHLQLKVFQGWIAAPQQRLAGVPMLIGKEHDSESSLSLDILLPAFPWLEKAVLRAQENIIDFGFAMLPMLTPEDLLVAKQFALVIEPNRHQDRDDIQSILANENELDFNYLNSELNRLDLPLIQSQG